MGLNIKYLNNNNIIKYRKLNYSIIETQKAKDIFHHILKICNDFNIKLSNIISITTDNCPAMILGIKLFNEFLNKSNEKLF